MNNNILLFRFYVIISFIFLIPFFLFINLELYKLLKIQFLLKENLTIGKLNVIDINKNKLKLFIKLYMYRNKWFIAISLLELSEYLNIIDSFDIDNLLAYAYQNLSYLQLSEYYYLKALLYKPNNINTLSNLANIYNSLAKNDEALKIYRRISILDSNYLIPTNYLINI
uniref:Uncharacterized protein n=1 Tax=Acrosorium ciliolatum TaxID=1550622 RepID=A0A1Z1M1D8_9FLOR|nr:hypothetical protein [Acrosorium ciliolatum]ARW59898.1 hypothetical protein [Acrosorium ciliolatum]